MGAWLEHDEWLRRLFEIGLLEMMLNPTEPVTVFFECRCVVRTPPGVMVKHPDLLCPAHPELKNNFRWRTDVPPGCPDYHCITLALFDYHNHMQVVGRVNQHFFDGIPPWYSGDHDE